MKNIFFVAERISQNQNFQKLDLLYDKKNMLFSVFKNCCWWKVIFKSAKENRSIDYYYWIIKYVI